MLCPRSPVRTTCPYCGVGCGVRARTLADGTLEIQGDETHPANLGRLCVKGAALGETLDLRGRLLHPMVRAGGDFERASWDDALNRVAQGFGRAIERHGAESVALYVSGQLLTEDYYVANKLVKGWFGTGNIDTNSRLCMSSAVAGYKRAFGADAMPLAYEDLERADLVVLVGSNTAWCHPVLYQRMLAARAARGAMKLVLIDPRRTPTCEEADLHLPIRPGTDAWLFNGLLAYLSAQGCADQAFVAQHTSGAARAVELAKTSTGSSAHVARACGLSEARLLAFYRLFAATGRVVTAFSQGVNQSSSGVDKVNAIVNCHLFTGRIGKPGAGPFSFTGQPNAMGGREAGGLATALAAHLDFDEPARALVQGFWGSPRIAARPGLKAVELFEAVRAGRIKALWIMATNPVVSLPDANTAARALCGCEFVVVSEAMARTDTSALAHVLLPAAAWGEKDGTVTNSERRISRQRAFLPLPGEARPDWWIVTQVARRMGFGAGFPYESACEIFAEHARLSAHGQADMPRAFDLGGLAQLTRAQYDALAPVQWPVRAGGSGTPRLFTDGRYFHPGRKAKLIALVPRAPAHAADDDYPLVLNTGRVRDQWHSMSRTAKSPRLALHRAEPTLELHPQDALACGVQAGRLARVATRWGSCVLRVCTTSDQARRQIFVPIHWNGRTASDARVGALVNPACDPLSGEPEFKHTPARVEPFEVDWHGFVLAREDLQDSALAALAWWARIEGTHCVRYELAGRGRPPSWSEWARALLGAPIDADWLEASDASRGVYRAAQLAGERLAACLYVCARPAELPAREWLGTLFARASLAEIDRVSFVAGSPPAASADTGPTVCSCFGVGRNQIVQAIARGVSSVQALGSLLRCGTSCGSCVPELSALLRDVPAQVSAGAFGL